MLKHYKVLLPKDFNTYVEPFFGGGAMFVWAFSKNPEATFVINDINQEIIDIYKSIKNELNVFINRMEYLSGIYLPLSKDDRKKFYFDLRSEYAWDYKKWSKAEESATLYFLMKTGFNGIWQINKNTNGRYGTPAGLLTQKDKVYDKENVIEWSRALENTILLCGDYSSVEKYVDATTFIFMDPPYRESFTQYNTDFTDKEQIRLLGFLSECKDKGATSWMSNRHGEDGFWEKNANKFVIHKFPVTYTAGRRKKTENGFEAKKAVEILITSQKIQEHNVN